MVLFILAFLSLSFIILVVVFLFQKFFHFCSKKNVVNETKKNPRKYNCNNRLKMLFFSCATLWIFHFFPLLSFRHCVFVNVYMYECMCTLSARVRCAICNQHVKYFYTRSSRSCVKCTFIENFIRSAQRSIHVQCFCRHKFKSIMQFFLWLLL